MNEDDLAGDVVRQRLAGVGGVDALIVGGEDDGAARVELVVAEAGEADRLRAGERRGREDLQLGEARAGEHEHLQARRGAVGRDGRVRVVAARVVLRLRLQRVAPDAAATEVLRLVVAGFLVEAGVVVPVVQEVRDVEEVRRGRGDVRRRRAGRLRRVVAVVELVLRRGRRRGVAGGAVGRDEIGIRADVVAREGRRVGRQPGVVLRERVVLERHHARGQKAGLEAARLADGMRSGEVALRTVPRELRRRVDVRPVRERVGADEVVREEHLAAFGRDDERVRRAVRELELDVVTRARRPWPSGRAPSSRAQEPRARTPRTARSRPRCPARRRRRRFPSSRGRRRSRRRACCARTDDRRR